MNIGDARAWWPIVRALSLLAGVAMVLVSVEGAFRILAYRLGSCHPACFTQYDETLGWTNTPGAVAPHRNPALGFDVTYRINAFGLRGRASDRIKPQGTYRIVVLGDSNGFGWGVPDGKHVGAILEDTLDRVEVINLSVTGYGTDQELLRFHRDGVGWNPDLVILQVTPNDFDDIQDDHAAHRPKPRFLLAGDGSLRLSNVPVRVTASLGSDLPGPFLPLAARGWLARESFAYGWLIERHAVRAMPAARRERFSPEGIELFNRLVMELESDLRRASAEGLIVHASEAISKLAIRSHGLPILDLSPRFAELARRGSGDPLYADGLHWNEAGHALAAREIRAFLIRHGYRAR